jgi:hypothetical protein
MGGDGPKNLVLKIIEKGNMSSICYRFEAMLIACRFKGAKKVHRLCIDIGFQGN